MLSFLEKIVPFETLPNAISFQDLAEKNSASLAYFLPNEKTRALKLLQIYCPDLIISIRFGMIFSSEMIATSSLGILNLHSGILPNYRGVMPSFWAMHNNDSEIGCSLHWIQDATIDTGDIVAIHRQPLDRSLCYIGNVAKLYAGGIKIFEDALTQILSSRFPSTSAQPEGESYYSFPTENHLETFYKNDWKLFSSAGYKIALDQATA
jgi:methionyl-tRNA formyltransferase